MSLTIHTATLDTNSIEEWLHTIYPTGTPGLMHISSKGNWKGRPFPTTDVAAAVAYIKTQDQREGIYLRATTLRTTPEDGGRGHATDSLALPGLWADLDIAGPGHKHELCPADCPKGHTHITLPLPPNEAAARDIITASGLPEPTLWVHSGGGLYPWWMLTQPALIDDTNRDNLAELSAQWQHIIGRAARSIGWHYGTGVGDLARVLRIPGTVNRKAGGARPCHIIESGGTAYTLTDLKTGLTTGQTRHPEPQHKAPAAPAPRTPATPRTQLPGDISPFDDFEAHVGWDDALLLADWTLHKGTPGGYCEWVRPGKNPHDGISATTGLDAGRDRLKVFTDGTEFEQGAVYTKGGAYAVLHHGGDHTAAARELARLGWGTPRPTATHATASTVPQPAQERPDPATFAAQLGNLDNDTRLTTIHKLIEELASEPPVAQQRYRDALIAAGHISKGDWQEGLADAKRRAKENRKAQRDKQNAQELQARREGGHALKECPYYEEGGRTYIRDDDGIPTKLADFVPKVIAETKCDDGVEVTRLVTIRLTRPSGYYNDIEVPSAQLRKSADWAMRALGPSARITPMPRDEAHVWTAAQYFGGDEWESNVRYSHTGWRNLGEWRFLTTSGALGEHDLDRDVVVDLDNERLNYYRLPDPGNATAEQLGNAIRASINLLDVAPDSTTALMLGATYQAPLPIKPETSVFISGPSGSMKSVITALACQHYGAQFNYKALPAEWKSTANSLEAAAFQLPDVLFLIDDYAPQSVEDPRKLAASADKVFRGSANSSARGRLRADGTQRPAKYPRAQILATGEDVPPGESLRARLTIATLKPGKVALELLNEAQADGDAGVYTLAMAGYIRWLAGRRNSGEDLTATVTQKIAAYRSELSNGVGHLRAPGAAASLLAAWWMWLKYATSQEAISGSNATQIFKRVKAAIVAAMLEQAEHTKQMRVEQIYLTALVGALASGRAHLADRETLTEPQGTLNPIEWGWAPQETPEGPSRWIAKGDRIGWVDSSDGSVYLHPDSAFMTAVAHAERGRTPLNAGKTAVHQHLEQARALVSVTRNKQGEVTQVTVTKRIGGKPQKVLHLRSELLTGEQPEPGEEPLL